MTYLTPTQKRLMEMLRDGEHHQIEDLESILKDMGSGTDKQNDKRKKKLLRVHIHMLREELRAQGKTIINEGRAGRRYYCVVKYLGKKSSTRGRA